MLYGVLFSALTGYLLGSIPSGLLVGRARGIDIRQHGSGNIGATNVFRTLGRKWGVLVFALDVLKGAVAVVLAERVLAPLPICGLTAAQAGIVAALACILGHNFPVWIGFKGGKGVATSAGVLIGLMPGAVAIGLVLWAAVYYTTRYVSVASIAAAVALPGIVWGLERQIAELFWFSVVISALAIWRHRANIQRLIAGTEHRFEKKKA